jgi:localization factor PodJL
MLRPVEPAHETAPSSPVSIAPEAPAVAAPPGSIAEAAARLEQEPASTVAAPQALLETAAERGDSVAVYELARQKLASGSSDEGFTLMRKAADKGLAAAQYRLAKLFERGEGTPADIAAARQWTERAALGGNRSAMHDLGVYYARGEGVALNEAQAYRWFRQAADLGMTNSQYNLGVLYQTGRGVAADPEEALFWFGVAAASGDSDAAARSVSIAGKLAPGTVAQIDSRAAAFRPKPVNPRANGDFGPQPWTPPGGSGAVAPPRG